MATLWGLKRIAVFLNAWGWLRLGSKHIVMLYPQHSHMALRGGLERIAMLSSSQSFGCGSKTHRYVILNTAIWLHLGV